MSGGLADEVWLGFIAALTLLLVTSLLVVIRQPPWIPPPPAKSRRRAGCPGAGGTVARLPGTVVRAALGRAGAGPAAGSGTRPAAAGGGRLGQHVRPAAWGRRWAARQARRWARGGQHVGPPLGRLPGPLPGPLRGPLLGRSRRRCRSGKAGRSAAASGAREPGWARGPAEPESLAGPDGGPRGVTGGPPWGPAPRPPGLPSPGPGQRRPSVPCSRITWTVSSGVCWLVSSHRPVPASSRSSSGRDGRRTRRRACLIARASRCSLTPGGGASTMRCSGYGASACWQARISRRMASAPSSTQTYRRPGSCGPSRRWPRPAQPAGRTPRWACPVGQAGHGEVVEHQVDVDVRGPVEVQREQPGDGGLARARYAGEQIGPGVLPGQQLVPRRGGHRLGAQALLPLGHHPGDLGSASGQSTGPRYARRAARTSGTLEGVA